MKPKNTLLGVAVFYCLNLGAQNIDYVLHFDKGSHELLPTEKQNLEYWALSHYHVRHEPLLLRGHTDEDADSKSNIELSKRRNQTVHTLLTMNGFDNISFKFYGEDWPICNEKDEKCMSVNRRVEVLLLEEENEKWGQNTLLESPQVKFIQSSENNIVKGEQGTKLAFPKNTFINTSGIPVENIRVELKEYYSAKDCLLKGMTTQCDGKLLESGGMIELKVFDETGSELVISGGSKPLISFKNEAEKKDNMQLFYGKIQKGKMNWQLEPAENFNIDDPLFRIASANGFDSFEAKDGEIVVFHDSKLGWVSILVSNQNSLDVKKIRDTPDKKRTVEQRKVLQKLVEQTEIRRIEKEKEWREIFEKMNIENNVAPNRNKQIESNNIEKIKWLESNSNRTLKEETMKQKDQQSYASEIAKMQKTFQLRGTGFINCDRFITSSPENQVSLSFEITEKINYSAFIYVPELHCVIAPLGDFITSDQRLEFSSIPEGMQIQLVIIGKGRDSDYLYCETLNKDEKSPIRITPSKKNERERETMMNRFPLSV
jgi:hypothetical protein